MPIETPLLTVDIIIECQGGIVLIERKNPPHGWALPGGFVDRGESVEQAATREAKEETSLDVKLIEQMHTYSDPQRDPRMYTASVVFIAAAAESPKGSDDARRAVVFRHGQLPEPLVFDHGRILNDYYKYKAGMSRQQVFGY
ncbi:MAG: NUDIX hydrolase [Desulfatitalea sp. BRH_c12]|nr:MAG: NUDIX hydrolase [Desulfatitalea sp. BRH_c12]